MSFGETLGTRSLVSTKETQAYGQAEQLSLFTNEFFQTLNVSELDSLFSDIDQRVQKRPTSQLKLEFNDAFALRRDIRYGVRSRKWLMAKGLQTKLNTHYAGWRAFVVENNTRPAYLKTLPSKDVKQLTVLSLQTVLGL